MIIKTVVADKYIFAIMGSIIENELICVFMQYLRRVGNIACMLLRTARK